MISFQYSSRATSHSPSRDGDLPRRLSFCPSAEQASAYETALEATRSACPNQSITSSKPCSLTIGFTRALVSR